MRPEPRSMTAADIMALVAGVGLGIVLHPPKAGALAQPAALGGDPAIARQAFMLSLSVTFAVVAVAVVVIARLIRYDRRARPAEWLAILAAIVLASDRPDWQVDHAINVYFGKFRKANVSFATLRWAMAGLATMTILGIFGVIRLESRALPPWVKSLAVAWLAFLTLWGPIRVMGINGPDLLAPSGGFGGGIGPATYWLTCQHLAWVPFGLVFGVPLIAAIDARVRRFPWAWTDWAGVTSFLVALLVAATLRRGMVPGLSVLSAIEKGLDIAWVFGVSLLSRWILIRSRPAWSRWFDTPEPGQGVASTSGDASPASSA